jgi:uncharacterized protein (TIGR02466 family)
MQNRPNEKIQAIFPTLIYCKKFISDEFTSIQSEITSAVKTATLGTPWPEAVETSFKFKENNNVIDQYNMVVLKKSIMIAAYNYLESIPSKVIPDMYIESNWVAKISTNGSMHSHTHPFSFLSGCYYFKTTGGEGDLVFENPNSIMDWVDPYSDIWPNNYRITPEEGLMVIFPSWLRHRVDINKTKNDRWCLSFNINHK